MNRFEESGRRKESKGGGWECRRDHLPLLLLPAVAHLGILRFFAFFFRFVGVFVYKVCSFIVGRGRRKRTLANRRPDCDKTHAHTHGGANT